MAWLNVTPEKHKEPRYEVFGWEVPDLHPDETLHNVWQELGEARDGQPLEWQELQAYANMTGEALDAEEWRILREMSVAYCSQLRRLSPFEPSPMERALNDD